MTERNSSLVQPFHISTHILTKRMTLFGSETDSLKAFQLTSSRRGWHGLNTMVDTVTKISTHILTKRMTELDEGYDTIVTFQLTSSRRGWPGRWRFPFPFYHISTHILTKRMTVGRGIFKYCNCNFNSHPHEEDDNSNMCVLTKYNISTHILTKRMTLQLAILFQLFLFQLTSSRRGWQQF